LIESFNGQGTAWRSKPSWFIVATKDRTVQPELQRFVAKRMGSRRPPATGRFVSCFGGSGNRR
jgi:hypothetical protein